MEKISLQELIAINNTPKAKALIIRYGYEPAQNYEDLVYKLFRLTKEYKKEALQDLAELHPHKDLILNYFQRPECDCQKPEKIRKRIGRRYSNFEMSDDYIDVEGEKDNSDNKVNGIEKYMPMIAIAGIFALAITSISR
tara:strand:- start:289 stop:705 length:417 start_codon:yes stop_codon:yes gene_type:complete